MKQIKTFESIFSDFSIPFDERLNEAVELAKKELRASVKIREIFRVFNETGMLFIDSTNYEKSTMLEISLQKMD